MSRTFDARQFLVSKCDSLAYLHSLYISYILPSFLLTSLSLSLAHIPISLSLLVSSGRMHYSHALLHYTVCCRSHDHLSVVPFPDSFAAQRDFFSSLFSAIRALPSPPPPTLSSLSSSSSSSSSSSLSTSSPLSLTEGGDVYGLVGKAAGFEQQRQQQQQQQQAGLSSATTESDACSTGSEMET